MRQNDILILLEDVRENIVFIQSEHRKAIDDDVLKVKLQVKVKSCFENLRSCLDYCAHDIYEKRVSLLNKKVYFPYAKTSKEFYKHVRQNFNKDFYLKNPDVCRLLESIQSYNSKNSWLVDLCDTTNKIKHDGLIEQEVLEGLTLTDKRTNFIKVGGNGVTVIRDCKFGDKKVSYMEISGIKAKTDIDFNTSGLNLIDWSTLKFHGGNIDILNLLLTAHKNITDLQSKLYLLLT